MEAVGAFGGYLTFLVCLLLLIFLYSRAAWLYLARKQELEQAILIERATRPQEEDTVPCAPYFRPCFFPQP